MTDKATLHQLIEDLPESGLLTAERFLASLRQKEVTETLARLAHEGPLYDNDFYQWTQTQRTALLDKDFAALDLEYLAEEIDDLGVNIQHAITSQLERLLLHLLKWRYDPAQDPRRLWRVSILAARHEIAKHIRRNPSLRDYPVREFPDAYRYARRVAAIETDLPLATFPKACPWLIEQVLDDAFLPEAEEEA